MSSLKDILGDYEDDYHQPSYNSHEAEGSSSHANTSTLVYRGSSNKPSKSNKSSGGGSSSSSKPSGSSSKSSHRHSSKSKSSGKGKHKATDNDNIEEADDYEDYNQSSAQYTMDSGGQYGSSSSGHYYQQSQYGHHGHHGSSRGGRGGYYMDPNAGTGFASVQGSAVMHNSGVAMDGSYDTSSMSHQYNAVPMDSSGIQTQGGMLVHYSNGTPVNANSEVEYTPVTRRESRAKKGKPVHFCDACEPRRTFTRAEHLRRHQLSHGEPRFVCTFPGCTRIFYRSDLLHRHELKQHTGRMVSNGSGSNDSTDWRSSSGEEMPHEADDGDDGPSNRRGSTQSSDSPGDSWANSGAVRSTTHFSLSSGYPGNRSDNNYDSSTNPGTGDAPTGRQRRRRPSNVGKSGPKSRSGSGSTRAKQPEMKTETKTQDEMPSLDDSQPLEQQSSSMHIANAGNLDNSIKTGEKDQGNGRRRSTRTLDKTKTHSRHPTETTIPRSAPGVHGFVIGGMASNTHHQTFHGTAEPEHHTTTNIVPYTDHLQTRNEDHGINYTQDDYSEPYMHAPSLQVQTNPYSRHTRSFTVPDAIYGGEQQSLRYYHQYHNSDPSPAAGWPQSTGSMEHDSSGHAITTNPVPFSHGSLTETIAVTANSAEGMNYSLPTAYTAVSGVNTSNGNHVGTASPSTHGYESMPSPYLYEQTARTLAGQSIAFVSTTAQPLRSVMAPNLPLDIVSARSGTSYHHIDSDSSSSSWTASASLPSSATSSSRHTCTSIGKIKEE